MTIRVNDLKVIKYFNEYPKMSLEKELKISDDQIIYLEKENERLKELVEKTSEELYSEFENNTRVKLKMNLNKIKTKK
jgi:hypothetical protein